MQARYIGSVIAGLRQPRSWKFKVVMVVVATLVFFVALPVELYLVGLIVQKYFIEEHWKWFLIGFSLVNIVAGIAIAVLAVAVQARTVSKSPAEENSPDALIVDGPYHYRRNPALL